MKKLIFIIILFLAYNLNSFADEIHFIDFAKVLNTSKPGAEAQKNLKSKFKSNSQKFKKLEQDIRKEEAEIISQKNVLSAEEYKKKLETLRKKVADMQRKKQESLNSTAESRNAAKKSLLEAVNPILEKYTAEKGIKIIIDKQSVVLGVSSLEITDQIIAILNKELPSLKIN